MSNDQAQISVLEFPESVRKRKEMYLMDKTHCVYEIVDNAIDEYSAGHCNDINIKVHNEIVTIKDNGRGIPVTPHPDPKFEGLSQAEVAFTVLHAGGKFGNEGSYKTATSGLHGVGSSCVNAVSEYMNLFICTGGKKYEINFKKGIIVSNLKEIESDIEGSGTEIEFKLDNELWGEEKIDYKKLNKRILQLAYLNPNLNFNLDIISEEDNIKEKQSYKFKDGIKAYIEKISANKEKICEIAHKTIDTEKTQIDISFVFTNNYSQEIYTFCNNVPTEQGGDHLTGFKLGFYKAIESYALENNFIKDPSEIESDDTREGICCILSVKTLNPKFEGQGKTKIKMPEIRTPVKKAIEDFILDYLNLDYERSKKIINKILLAAKSRIAAKKAREASRGKQDLFDSSGLPGKLIDCQSKNAEECELFIAEGDSASGTAKQARDRKYQAIIPIFGKILNVEKSTVESVLKNPKLMDLLKVLKCGIDNTFDISKLRYHKIILLADADQDGFHIQCLYLTFFYRYLRPIIEKGYLYLAMPPLFSVKSKKEIRYYYSTEEMKDVTDNDIITRFKGLGEMSSEALWETSMSPDTRKLIQVKIEDLETSNAGFDLCMGTNPEPRKEFIIENACFFVDNEIEL